MTIFAGVAGLIGGTVFAVLLAALQRRRDLAELKPARMALWGALDGLLLPLDVVGVLVAVSASLEPDIVGAIIIASACLGQPPLLERSSWLRRRGAAESAQRLQHGAGSRVQWRNVAFAWWSYTTNTTSKSS